MVSGYTESMRMLSLLGVLRLSAISKYAEGRV